MASVRIYCDCKVNEIGTAKIDLYNVPLNTALNLMDKKENCKHCGKPLKYVGEDMTENKANKIDAMLAKVST
jgi:hypothetical protein